MDRSDNISESDFELAVQSLKPPAIIGGINVAPKCPVENQAKNLDLSDDRVVDFQVFPGQTIRGVILKSDDNYITVVVLAADNPFWGEDVFLDVLKVNVLETKPNWGI